MANVSFMSNVLVQLILATLLLFPLFPGLQPLAFFSLFLLTRLSSTTQGQITASTGIDVSLLNWLVTPAKVLLALQFSALLHRSLQRLALNNWRLRWPGQPWCFGDQKLSELIVITGGSSGFGRLMTKGFAGKARVIVLDVAELPDDLACLKEVHFYKCDLTDTAATKAVAATIREKHGDPSVLINNAGIAMGASIIDVPTDFIERIFQVNIVSHFVLIKEFLPAMLQAKKGHIVSLASIASFAHVPGIVHYCCTKTAANYLMDGLRTELLTRYENGNTICTTSVHPTFHDTPMIKNITGGARSTVPLFPPQDVADKVVEQVLNGRSGKQFMPKGQYWVSFVKYLPTWTVDILMYLRTRKVSKKRQ